MLENKPQRINFVKAYALKYLVTVSNIYFVSVNLAVLLHIDKQIAITFMHIFYLKRNTYSQVLYKCR